MIKKPSEYREISLNNQSKNIKLKNIFDIEQKNKN